MELKLAQTIVEILEDIGYENMDEISIREDYNHSYKNSTVAIVGLSLQKLIGIVIENADRFVTDDDDDWNGISPIFDNVGNIHQDQLGLTTIIY